MSIVLRSNHTVRGRRIIEPRKADVSEPPRRLEALYPVILPMNIPTDIPGVPGALSSWAPGVGSLALCPPSIGGCHLIRRVR